MADQNIVPFAEGAPADDLMVEELADGDVLIGAHIRGVQQLVRHGRGLDKATFARWRRTWNCLSLLA
mgnify:CR=1 FL=1